jgi:hypothetical protein
MMECTRERRYTTPIFEQQQMQEINETISDDDETSSTEAGMNEEIAKETPMKGRKEKRERDNPQRRAHFTTPRR